ncbi:hypothetical protein PTSG_07598 [Salpingoeca rosetta]|uniref:p53 DNA-binding domain-containing protein n=1 Tax=Salpingoeca rosetta (strain ATCC 50818 / BSB-021) TaxID=946362 RepID=F2UH83_SALR5|nr:uncharacterized protein PTSG_07598 [Salpingoeca rosetta]EGD76482.1 hypothetical protein PTSG_07598 [Salpingoeca rosetta]|eukprot:XP_004991396.1 hypothetical protein PTSG_07598 [Salpingoeca rosetta]
MQAGARREDSLGRDIKVDIEDLLSTREASTIGISSFDVPFDQLELDRTCDFLIETVQLNDGFEDPTPVVDLPGKGRVKLPRVPTTSAELEHTPSKYPGPFNFQLQFIDDSGGKPVPRATPFTYSPQAQRLFVQMNHKVPFRFSISDRVPNGTWLRIRTRFTQPEFRNRQD